MPGFFDTSMFEKKKPHESPLRRCGLCKVCDICKTPKMPVHGNGRSKILIVGNQPSREDDSEGRPFSGWLGDLLRDEFDSYGLDLFEDAWVMNAIACCPDESSKGIDLIADYCKPGVHQAITTLRPNVVITMGDHAMRSVIEWLWKESPGALTRWAGWQIPAMQHNMWVCPTYSDDEMKADRDGVLSMLWQRHVGVAVALRGGRPHPSDNEEVLSRCCVVNDETKAIRLLEAATDTDTPTAFDYETTCLKPDGSLAEVVSFSLCSDVPCGLPLSHAFIVTPRLIPYIRDFLVSKTPKIASNQKFEHRWSQKHFQCAVNNWLWDTMLAAHVLDNRQGISSIKFQSFVLLGVPSYDDTVHPFLTSEGSNTANRIRECDQRELLRYNAMDSLLELLVWKKQERLITCRT